MAHDIPFPAERVRDVLGIARNARRAPEFANRLADLDEVVVELEKALALGVYPPPSLGYRAAFDRAERATAKLAALISPLDGAEGIMRAACDEVLRARAG